MDLNLKVNDQLAIVSQDTTVCCMLVNHTCICSMYSTYTGITYSHSRIIEIKKCENLFAMYCNIALFRISACQKLQKPNLLSKELSKSQKGLCVRTKYNF